MYIYKIEHVRYLNNGGFREYQEYFTSRKKAQKALEGWVATFESRVTEQNANYAYFNPSSSDEDENVSFICRRIVRVFVE
jgi:predicted component of type VI protein secretion system